MPPSVPAGPEGLDPAWIGDRLREGGLPGARVGGIRSEVIGLGYGLDGTVARVALEGGGGIPPTVVAKFTKAPRGEREFRFLREVGPLLPIPVPRLLGGAVDAEADRGVLLLEDQAPARQGDMVRGATEAEALALARAAGRLHGAFWGREVPGSLPLWGTAKDFLPRALERRPRFLELWGDRIPPAVRVLVERFEERVPAATAELESHPATLVHTDLHLDNVLFRPDGTPVILDWPDARRGAAAVDVVRLLGEGPTIAERRRIQDRMLDAWAVGAAVEGYGRADLVRGVLLAAIRVLAGTAWWAGRDDPRAAEPRVAAIIEATVLRHAALLEDLLGETG